jgi:gluconolactonase
MSRHPKSAGWREHPRYPDPLIETLDPRFDQYRIFSAAVERLYTGCRWAEGRSGSATAAICCGAISRTTAF